MQFALKSTKVTLEDRQRGQIAGVKGEVMELSRERSLETRGLLYPLMVIAAIALIAFSLLGIATITGWMPNALAHSEIETARDVTFECAECGMLESMRDLERRDRSGGRADVVAFSAFSRE
jgi:hypothetical protein